MLRRMGSWDWLQVNVAGLLNTVGIVGGLLFTAFSFRDARRERELSNLIALTEAHREIWSQLRGEPNLARVIDDSADLVHAPATKEEEVFITSLILHLYCVYRATKLGMYPHLEGLRRDVREFYSLPIPSQVWERMKSFQDRDFVSFVEDALRT